MEMRVVKAGKPLRECSREWGSDLLSEYEKALYHDDPEFLEKLRNARVAHRNGLERFGEKAAYDGICNLLESPGYLYSEHVQEMMAHEIQLKLPMLGLSNDEVERFMEQFDGFDVKVERPPEREAQ